MFGFFWTPVPSIFRLVFSAREAAPFLSFFPLPPLSGLFLPPDAAGALHVVRMDSCLRASPSQLLRLAAPSFFLSRPVSFPGRLRAHLLRRSDFHSPFVGFPLVMPFFDPRAPLAVHVENTSPFPFFSPPLNISCPAQNALLRPFFVLHGNRLFPSFLQCIA